MSESDQMRCYRPYFLVQNGGRAVLSERERNVLSEIEDQLREDDAFAAAFEGSNGRQPAPRLPAQQTKWTTIRAILAATFLAMIGLLVWTTVAVHGPAGTLCAMLLLPLSPLLLFAALAARHRYR